MLQISVVPGGDPFFPREIGVVADDKSYFVLCDIPRS